MDNKRLGWIDAMRGFSMVTIVMGHVILSMGIDVYDSVLSSLLHSFNLPLFFFVSGFFSYRAIDWWNKDRFADNLKRKVQALIICTLFFFSIYQILLGKGYVSFSNGFEGYWFTIALFQMWILYLVSTGISRLIKLNINYLLLLALSLVGIAIIVFFRRESSFWTILSWENLSKYFQFFALGIFSSGFKEGFYRLMKNNLYATIVILGWILCLILYYNETFRLSFPFAYSFIHDILIRYCALLTVVLAFFRGSEYMEKSACGKNLQLVGRRTLDIYMIHYFLLPHLKFLGPWLSIGNQFVMQFLISGIFTVIIVFLSLLISKILRESRFLSAWLFGVKEKMSHAE